MCPIYVKDAAARSVRYSPGKKAWRMSYSTCTKNRWGTTIYVYSLIWWNESTSRTWDFFSARHIIQLQMQHVSFRIPFVFYVSVVLSFTFPSWRICHLLECVRNWIIVEAYKILWVPELNFPRFSVLRGIDATHIFY